jgi:hypothetical protein
LNPPIVFPEHQHFEFFFFLDRSIDVVLQQFYKQIACRE